MYCSSSFFFSLKNKTLRWCWSIPSYKHRSWAARKTMADVGGETAHTHTHTNKSRNCQGKVSRFNQRPTRKRRFRFYISKRYKIHLVLKYLLFFFCFLSSPSLLFFSHRQEDPPIYIPPSVPRANIISVSHLILLIPHQIVTRACVVDRFLLLFKK